MEQNSNDWKCWKGTQHHWLEGMGLRGRRLLTPGNLQHSNAGSDKPLGFVTRDAIQRDAYLVYAYCYKYAPYAEASCMIPEMLYGAAIKEDRHNMAGERTSDPIEGMFQACLLGILYPKE